MLAQPVFFGAGAINAVAKTANDALKPFQRRARANARRLGRPGRLR